MGVDRRANQDRNRGRASSARGLLNQALDAGLGGVAHGAGHFLGAFEAYQRTLHADLEGPDGALFAVEVHGQQGHVLVGGLLH
ncbi:hypothetical protein G6F24_016830 [Rhizopus arrhizus]|nr:hypothetical protein G6F24_016830 [Rhizopus arrhizus]